MVQSVLNPDMKMEKIKTAGFTIVELLIVIVVIGILAALVLNTFAGAQDRARAAKVENDVAVLEKAIIAARMQTGQTLMEITGSDDTRCSCPYSGGTMTDYSTLPKSHGCWITYYDTLDDIGSAAGTNLDQLKTGDPWGSPYGIDENEGELSANPCRTDSIWSFGKSKTNNGHTQVGFASIRLSLLECI